MQSMEEQPQLHHQLDALDNQSSIEYSSTAHVNSQIFSHHHQLVIFLFAAPLSVVCTFTCLSSAADDFFSCCLRLLSSLSCLSQLPQQVLCCLLCGLIPESNTAVVSVGFPHARFRAKMPYYFRTDSTTDSTTRTKTLCVLVQSTPLTITHSLDTSVSVSLESSIGRCLTVV